MGYMGFGLQKWIYSQRPRKPFSNERKQSFDSIPNHSNRKLNISGLTSKNPETLDDHILQRKKRIRIRWIGNKIIGLTLAIVLIMALTFLLIRLFYSDNNVSKKSTYRKETQVKNDNEAAFDLAISYAKNYLEKGDYDLAINEFNNALMFKPSNIYARSELAKTYYLTCIKNDKNCDEAIKQYSKLISMDTSCVYFKYRSELYLHIGDYNSANLDIDRFENANK